MIETDILLGSSIVIKGDKNSYTLASRIKTYKVSLARNRIVKFMGTTFFFQSQPQKNPQNGQHFYCLLWDATKKIWIQLGLAKNVNAKILQCNVDQGASIAVFATERRIFDFTGFPEDKIDVPKILPEVYTEKCAHFAKLKWILGSV
ncbi:uncharacterized protein LOC114524135 [Dendronephthya gigantea]|uniref:uncharacterized protein LOC114524135 n=1 Tax=Dendronephthya gigantea TaxID=151771 RepID=UPI001069059D|nr:uncharacterized protein LOC114524135 [Dendronephthya gigantea]